MFVLRRLAQPALKRFYRFVLRRAIGQFLLEELDLEQLDVQLGEGSITLTELELDAEELNRQLRVAGTGEDGPASGIRVKSAFVGKLRAKLPYTNLLEESCELEAEDVSLVLEVVKDGGASRTARGVRVVASGASANSVKMPAWEARGVAGNSYSSSGHRSHSQNHSKTASPREARGSSRISAPLVSARRASAVEATTARAAAAAAAASASTAMGGTSSGSARTLTETETAARQERKLGGGGGGGDGEHAEPFAGLGALRRYLEMIASIARVELRDVKVRLRCGDDDLAFFVPSLSFYDETPHLQPAATTGASSSSSSAAAAPAAAAAAAAAPAAAAAGPRGGEGGFNASSSDPSAQHKVVDFPGFLVQLYSSRLDRRRGARVEYCHTIVQCGSVRYGTHSEREEDGDDDDDDDEYDGDDYGHDIGSSSRGHKCFVRATIPQSVLFGPSPEEEEEEEEEEAGRGDEGERKRTNATTNSNREEGDKHDDEDEDEDESAFGRGSWLVKSAVGAGGGVNGREKVSLSLFSLPLCVTIDARQVAAISAIVDSLSPPSPPSPSPSPSPSPPSPSPPPPFDLSVRVEVVSFRLSLPYQLLLPTRVKLVGDGDGDGDGDEDRAKEGGEMGEVEGEEIEIGGREGGGGGRIESRGLNRGEGFGPVIVKTLEEFVQPFDQEKGEDREGVVYSADRRALVFHSLPSLSCGERLELRARGEWKGN